MNIFKNSLNQKMNLAKSIVNDPNKFVKAVAYGNYDSLPFSFRDTLKKVGNQEIIKMEAVRAPISNMIMGIMNMFSGFELKKKIENSDYDSLFHLTLRVYTKRGNVFDIEKENVVKIGKAYKRPKQEVLPIPLSQPITINQLLQKAMDTIGMKKFTYYNGKNNNCQIFLLDILSSNGLLTDEQSNWIKQNTSELVFNNKNPYFRQIMNTVTTTGDRINVLMEGTGLKRKGTGLKKESAWIRHVRVFRETHPELTWRECLVEAKKSYKPSKIGSGASASVEFQEEEEELPSSEELDARLDAVSIFIEQNNIRNIPRNRNYTLRFQHSANDILMSYNRIIQLLNMDYTEYELFSAIKNAELSIVIFQNLDTPETTEQY